MSALREHYATLNKREDRAAHARELNGLAESLGRKTEARGWALILQRRAGREELVPEAVDAGTDGTRSGSLSARIGDLPDLNVLDSRRPGDVRTNDRGPAPARFADLAEAAGLTFFHDNGHTRKNPPPPEAMCGGVGLIDYDGDGWLDVYVVQGGEFPPRGTSFQAVAPPHGQDARATDVRVPNGDRLFRNLGNGHFEDVSRRSGIAGFPGGYGHGVAVADYDNDGRPDLFVTRWRSYALYRNRGDGTFEDVTAEAGLGGDRDWPTSSAFADLDNDGDLDLYVCHYLRYDPANPKRCEHPESPGERTCNPLDFPSLPDHVFRNDARSVRGCDRGGRHRRSAWARAGSRRGRPRRRRPGRPRRGQ